YCNKAECLDACRSKHRTLMAFKMVPVHKKLMDSLKLSNKQGGSAVSCLVLAARMATNPADQPPNKKTKIMTAQVEQLAIDTIRVTAAEMVQKAKSGHPGAPMGCAPIGHALYAHVMKYNAANPH
ncbi:hypothetical protein FOZ62_014910, partial [Perkinsus olseni]